MGINFHVVMALTKRDLRRYFSNPTGYVFITLFIFLSAAAAFWSERFFLNNLANLNQLNAVFPGLLLLFVPALTMAVWSDERKQGTDELLLTLPATDQELVLGKYLAVLGIYTASLVLSLSHVAVLFWLGSPDLGLMFGNYLGYWLLGAALISFGMVASLVTGIATIAFILGALLCSLLVYLDTVVGLFSPSLGRALSPVVVSNHFGDFARGVVSFSGLFYFLSLAALGIYLNVLLLQRRHWPRTTEGFPMWIHHTIRAAALVVVLLSINAVVARSSLRLDVTAERLHSLSDQTRKLIDELPDDRPVFVQAFVSPELPEAFVQSRENVLGLLDEIDSLAGSKVQVLVQETEPFTEAAREAREKFGIVPRRVPNVGSARAGFTDVFLGLAFTCGAEEQVIPFFDRGLPAEYEIARSIRVVAKTERRKIGVVQTAINVFGGFDFQSMSNSPAWSVVEELKKQYEVVQLQASAEITEEVDALVVVLPSSLPQPEMDRVKAVIQRGVPTLLLVDPLPLVNTALAPSERAGAERNPFASQGQPPPPPKGNIQGMLAELGLQWESGTIVWDGYNPHPDLADLPPEVVFIGRGNDNPDAFNQAHSASAELQELVLLYPGTLAATANPDFIFEPLLVSGDLSGTFAYPQLVRRSFFGMQLERNLPHRADPSNYVLAAEIRGLGTSEAPASEEGEEDADGATADPSSPVHLVVIADLDFISEQFFEIRKVGPTNLNFDNVTFFLNAIDTLIGDESFIALRNRRMRHRTLERVEDQTRSFVEKRAVEEQQAEADAQLALAEAQARLDDKVNEVQQRSDLDQQTKTIMARNLQEVENRRFEVLKANIETEKEAKVQRSKEDMESEVRRIQSGIRTFAVMLPPIPVFVLGVMIFVRRQRREKEGAAASRRLRS